MGYSKLLEKSEENEKAAEILAQNRLYNAATNRAYYFLYQKILYIVGEVEAGKSSHVKTINTLGKILQGQEKDIVRDINFIKQKRHESDYYAINPFRNPAVYREQILPKTIAVKRVLNSYIEKKDGV